MTTRGLFLYVHHGNVQNVSKQTVTIAELSLRGFALLGITWKNNKNLENYYPSILSQWEFEKYQCYITNQIV